MRVGGDAAQALDSLTRGSVSDWSNATIADYLGHSAHPARALVDLLVGLEGWGLGTDSVAIRRRSIQTNCALAQSMVGDIVVGPQDPLLGDCVGGLISAMPRHMRSLSLCELLGRISEGVYRLPGLDVVEVALDQLLEGLDQLRGRTLEDELADITLKLSGKQRTARIVCKREGWRSGYPMTLQEVAQEEGVTRERVRQICRKATEKIVGASSSYYMPALDRTLQVLAESVPATGDTVQVALQAQGVIRGPFTLPALANAATAFGRPFGFRQVASRGGSWICRLDDDALVDDDWSAIHLRALRLVDSQGAVSITQLLEALREQNHLVVDSSDLRAILSTTDGVEWLDSGREWFWMANRGATRVRLVNLILKALCVCQSMSVSELRAAVGRSRRLASVPPTDILIALCERIPQVRVNGESICASVPLDPKDALQGNELYVVDLMRQMGPVCRVEEMWQVASGEGIGKISFWTILRDSPTIVRYAKSTYGLRGVAAPATEVWDAANRRMHRSGGSQVCHGELDAENVWFVARLTEAMSTNGQVRLPLPLQGRFDGTFAVRSRGRATRWSCTVHTTHVSGIGRTLKMAAAEAGDLVLITVDSQDAIVNVVVGGDELSLVDEAGIRDLTSRPLDELSATQGTLDDGPTPVESAPTVCEAPIPVSVRPVPTETIVNAVADILRAAQKPMRTSDIAFLASRTLSIRVDRTDVEYCLKKSLKDRAALVSGSEWILLG